MHQDVEAWCRRYGDVFQMYLGPEQALVVADHEALAQVLKQRPDTFRRPALSERIMLPSLVKVALRLQQRWDGAARAGRAIDLSDDLKRYTVDIIAGLAFGTDVDTIDGGEEVITRRRRNPFPFRASGSRKVEGGEAIKAFVMSPVGLSMRLLRRSGARG